MKPKEKTLDWREDKPTPVSQMCEHCYCTITQVESPSDPSTISATLISIPHQKCCNCGRQEALKTKLNK